MSSRFGLLGIHIPQSSHWRCWSGRGQSIHFESERAMTEPSGSTGVQPSAEAIEVAIKMMKAGEAQGHNIAARAHDVLFAGFRVDTPAIHAAGVVEGRAAMLREVVEWLRGPDALNSNPLDHEGLGPDEFADAIEARFPSERTP